MGGWTCCTSIKSPNIARRSGALLFALAAYVVDAAGWNLWTQHHGEFSASGFIVTLLAVPIMRYLATRKIDLADRLGSRALRTDGVESITCGWLSVVAVVSLGAQAIFGAWWIDSVGSLAILWFLIKEGAKRGKASALTANGPATPDGSTALPLGRLLVQRERDPLSGAAGKLGDLRNKCTEVGSRSQFSPQSVDRRGVPTPIDEPSYFYLPSDGGVNLERLFTRKEMRAPRKAGHTA